MSEPNKPDKKWIADVKNCAAEAIQERFRQFEKWGAQTMSLADWNLVLTEEVGEAAQAVLCAKFNKGKVGPDPLMHAREELLQVAAVALAIVQQIDTGRA